MTDAIFTRDGDAFVATSFAAGPWNSGLQHGGAPSALCAWAAEQVATPAPMRIARLTVELLRPVPVARLTIATEVIRQGRKIQLVQVRLFHDGTEVTRAMAMKVRVEDMPLPGDVVLPPVDTLPDAVEDSGMGMSRTESFGANFEMRRIRGGFDELGPGRMWFRQHRATIAGEAISPVMRAAAVADFFNGIAPVLPFADWTFLNPDLTVSFARAPVGEWIFSDAETWAGADGTGLAMTRLADTQGYFARAVQSLLIEKR